MRSQWLRTSASILTWKFCASIAIKSTRLRASWVIRASSPSHLGKTISWWFRIWTAWTSRNSAFPTIQSRGSPASATCPASASSTFPRTLSETSLVSKISKHSASSIFPSTRSQKCYSSSTLSSLNCSQSSISHLTQSRTKSTTKVRSSTISTSSACSMVSISSVKRKLRRRTFMVLTWTIVKRSSRPCSHKRISSTAGSTSTRTLRKRARMI